MEADTNYEELARQLGLAPTDSPVLSWDEELDLSLSATIEPMTTEADTAAFEPCAMASPYDMQLPAQLNPGPTTSCDNMPDLQYHLIAHVSLSSASSDPTSLPQLSLSPPSAYSASLPLFSPTTSEPIPLTEQVTSAESLPPDLDVQGPTIPRSHTGTQSFSSPSGPETPPMSVEERAKQYYVGTSVWLNRVAQNHVRSLDSFAADPAGWSKNHGGKAKPSSLHLINESECLRPDLQDIGVVYPDRNKKRLISVLCAKSKERFESNEEKAAVKRAAGEAVPSTVPRPMNKFFVFGLERRPQWQEMYGKAFKAKMGQKSAWMAVEWDLIQEEVKGLYKWLRETTDEYWDVYKAENAVTFQRAPNGEGKANPNRKAKRKREAEQNRQERQINKRPKKRAQPSEKSTFDAATQAQTTTRSVQALPATSLAFNNNVTPPRHAGQSTWTFGSTQQDEDFTPYHPATPVERSLSSQSGSSASVASYQSHNSLGLTGANKPLQGQVTPGPSVRYAGPNYSTTSHSSRSSRSSLAQFTPQTPFQAWSPDGVTDQSPFSQRTSRIFPAKDELYISPAQQQRAVTDTGAHPSERPLQQSWSALEHQALFGQSSTTVATEAYTLGVANMASSFQPPLSRSHSFSQYPPIAAASSGRSRSATGQ
ncbi:hypothetical protein IAU60_004461 [Kwoniella sp. DSM 27419]